MKTCFAIVLACGPLVACGGGGGTLETTDIATEDIGVSFITGQSGPLSLSIESDGIAFPANLSLAFDPTILVTIAPDYRVNIRNIDGPIVSFGAADQRPSIDGFNQTFFKNGGTDGLIYRKPFTPTDIDTSSFGFDYVTFGIWLHGASENIALATEPYEVIDAGVISVGHVTPTAFLPTSGTATYVGDAIGILADCLIVEDILTGSVTAQADFGLRTVSANIQLDHSDGSPYGLIQSGVAAIRAPDAAFDAIDARSNQGMTGRVNGFFAGPGGEEIGGQFHLEEEGTERRVVGAFGAFNSGSP